ncbi:protein LHCP TRANSLOCATION DEFECT [Diospyros lotus]|uniref:protein LHCP TRANSLOCATION DEFECT n=1 Tax=Diospyros lotus TaxID=55363 RepID=UPI00224E76CB|nr:protein LHCP TRANSLOCATION DEFECT [Diospyros lotus]
MASLFCTVQPIFASQSRNSSPSSSSPRLPKIKTQFLGVAKRLGWVRPARIGPSSSGSRATCWFRFGKNGVDAEGAGIYGSQTRDDFDRDDVEQYFNYMGMLAVEGSYDKMEALLSHNMHPVDILLMMAASEGDKPKIEELLRAGADYTVKDANGLTALDKANSNEIKDLILGFSAKKA